MSNAEQAFWARMGVYFPNGDMGMVTNGGGVNAATERQRQADALIGTKAELNRALFYMRETADNDWDHAQAFARQQAWGEPDPKAFAQKHRRGVRTR
jgi:hypothetical protein